MTLRAEFWTLAPVTGVLDICPVRLKLGCLTQALPPHHPHSLVGTVEPAKRGPFATDTENHVCSVINKNASLEVENEGTGT